MSTANTLIEEEPGRVTVTITVEVSGARLQAGDGSCAWADGTVFAAALGPSNRAAGRYRGHSGGVQNRRRATAPCDASSVAVRIMMRELPRNGARSVDVHVARLARRVARIDELVSRVSTRRRCAEALYRELTGSGMHGRQDRDAAGARGRRTSEA
jgi:hypothetical protein